MQRKILFTLLTFLAFHQVNASIEQAINEKESLIVRFSRNSHNRISVDQGSVRKLLGDPSLFSVSIDETIGQAFVNVLQDIVEIPASLTVVTHSGQVQDILVFSDSKPSEHLILKEEAADLENLSFPSLELHTHTIEFLNEIFSGRTPLGYGKRELVVGDKLALPSPLEATPIRVFEGPFEKIAVYKIKNIGRKPIVLKASSIKKKGDHWVFIDVNELDFTEQALCIISSPKE